VKAPSKSPTETLRRKLLARSLDATRDAVDQLATIPDDALLTLFEGVGTAPPPADEVGLPVLTRSTFFTGRNGPEQTWLDVALLLLAPRVADRVPLAKALCASTSLHLYGGTQRPGLSLPMDVLAPYTALESLALSNLAPQRLDALVSLVNLRAVTLVGCALDALAELRAAVSIASLRIVKPSTQLPHLGAWPTLRALTFSEAPLTAADRAFEGLTGLRELTLSNLHESKLTPLAIPPSLTRASLTRCFLRGGIEGLAQCVALESLDLDVVDVSTLEPLRAMRSLARLRVFRCHALASLAPLAALTGLRDLRVTQTSVSDLSALRGLSLETLDLSQTSVSDLTPLREMVSLRSLAISTPSGFGDLSPLGGCTSLEALSALRVDDPYLNQFVRPVSTMRDLRWLTPLTRLRELAIDAPALESLRGVEGCAHLTTLTVARAKALTDLAPLTSLPHLARLSIAGADVADVGALASHTTLVTVDLRSNRRLADASPLWRIATLRRVALFETAVDRDSIPNKHRRTVTWARDADMERAFEPEAPPKPRVVVGPVGQGAAVRKRFSAIRTQLNAKDFDLIEQGAELLAALDDPSLFDEMIAGATWTDGTSLNRRDGLGGFTPPPALGATKTANTWQFAAIMAVLSRAPEGATAARALRDQITSIFRGSNKGWGGGGVVDLGPFGALPKLTRVWLGRPSEIRRADGLRGHASLTTFELATAHCDLSLDLSGCAALHSLSVDYATKVARIDLSGCAALRRLELTQMTSAASLDGADTLSGLRRVELSGDASVKHLAQLTTRDRIEHLTVVARETVGLEALVSECTALRSFELRGTGSPFNVAALTHAPKLARVALKICPQITDLEALTRVKGLEQLVVTNVPAAVPEALRPIVKRLGY
jgi:Leucine-rich repeat (LRR) protein